MSDGGPEGAWSRYPGKADDDHPGRTYVGDDGEVLVFDSTTAVVGLGAICGLHGADHDDHGRSGGRSGRFWVSEFARLTDGRRVILHEERGFTVGAPIGPGVGGPTRAGLRKRIVDTVLAIVLPDPEDGEAHPWEWLAALARARGLEVTADDLRGRPYEVVLTDGLTRRIGAS